MVTEYYPGSRAENQFPFHCDLSPCSPTGLHLLPLTSPLCSLRSTYLSLFLSLPLSLFRSLSLSLSHTKPLVSVTYTLS